MVFLWSSYDFSMGLGGAIFNEILRNGKWHRLHTHIPIYLSVVVNSPKHREAYIFIISRVGGHVKDFLILLFFTTICLCCVQHHCWKLLWATPCNRVRPGRLFFQWNDVLYYRNKCFDYRFIFGGVVFLNMEPTFQCTSFLYETTLFA